MNNQVGIAVIGAGYWGINFVRVFNELPGSRVVTVCDKRPERLHEIGQRFPGIVLTTSAEEAIGMKGVDAVVVATPATGHYHVARYSLLAGKPTLVEKPLTKTVVESEELLYLADSHNGLLMVGHTFVYNPAVRKVKDYIRADELGQLYYVYAQHTNLGPIRKDVNAIWDLAPHDVSIFNYWLDTKPEWVSAVGARVLGNGREDVGFVSLGYPNGVVGHIHVSWADPNKVREMVVVGSKQRIVFDDVNVQERVRVFEKGVAPAEPDTANYGEHQLLMRDGDIISPRIAASEPLKNECLHFLECIEQGINPISSGREGTDVVQVMEAIDHSIRMNGAPVQVELLEHAVAA